MRDRKYLIAYVVGKSVGNAFVVTEGKPTADMIRDWEEYVKKSKKTKEVKVIGITEIELDREEKKNNRIRTLLGVLQVIAWVAVAIVWVLALSTWVY